MAVFGCLRSGRAEGGQDFSEGRVLPVKTGMDQFLVLRSESRERGNGRNAHQVNTCCSSGLGNVVFGGEFGDEIREPSSNCDRR